MDVAAAKKLEGLRDEAQRRLAVPLHKAQRTREWQPWEVETLESMWTTAQWSEILSALPWRTRMACRRKAVKMSLKGRAVSSPEGRAAQAEGRRLCENPPAPPIVAPIFVRDGVEGKACVKCLEWKPLPKFARHKTCAGGRRNICTTCDGRLAYARNPEGRKRAVRAYQKSHPEAVREQKRASNRRRHGQKAAGRGIKAKEWRAIRAAFDDRCAYCGDPATTMDHVIPLSRGGLHEPENVVPACKPCNFEKHNKMPEDFRPVRDVSSRKD